MSSDAIPILKRIAAIPEWSLELIGFEPATVPFNQDDESEADQCIAIWREARANGIEVRLVRDGKGCCTIWRRTKLGPIWQAATLSGPPA